MGIYDIAMLVVLCGAILFGYWKGLAWQLASLAALIVSYIVAVNFRDQVAQFIQVEPPWNRIGAMLVLFLGTSLVIWTIYASVARSLKKHELRGFDRQAGAVLGAAKGALLCMVITLFSVSFLGESVHESIDHSRLGPYVEKGIWQISDYVPAELARFVDPHIATYKEAARHDEPVVDPNNLFRDALGTIYPLDTPLNQDPSQLPEGQQPAFQSPGYPGQWQTTSRPSNSFGTNQALPGNQDYQYGTNYGAQTPTIPPPLNSSGGPGGFLPSTTTSDWSNLGISDASRRILNDAGLQGFNQGLEVANQEARRLLDGQPTSNSIAETAQQILEDARRRGIDMGLDAATAAARRWLEGGQQR